MLLCLLKGMQGDTGLSGVDVAWFVEQHPHPEILLPSLTPFSNHMI